MYTKKTKNIAQNKNRSRVLVMNTSCNTWFVLEYALNDTQYIIFLMCKIDKLFSNFVQIYLINYE